MECLFCIIGGEVPMAFVSLSADALKRLERDPSQEKVIKESIMKVCMSPGFFSYFAFFFFFNCAVKRAVLTVDLL
jgi:hypothetical protein